jgi:hypothetical protein
MIILIISIPIFVICYIIYKWELVKNKTHIHLFNKPVASMYISFNVRDIVYKCKCGKGKIMRERYDFGMPFPIETNLHITKKELEQIADNKNIK